MAASRKTSLRAGCSLPALTLCALLLFACGTDSTPNYRTADLDTGDLLVQVNAVGTVHPLALTKVSTQLSGQVAEVLADFNDPVKMGQVLARLDDRELSARLGEARQALSAAEAALSRAEHSRAQS